MDFKVLKNLDVITKELQYYPFIIIKDKRYFLQINEKNLLLDENKLGKYSINYY